MSRSLDDRHPIDRLAEAFVERYRRGERPSASEYAAQYPEWADQIGELFSALLMMEQLKPPPPVSPRVLDEARDEEQLPRRLGDFLLLREIGRGGMGIVYEAIQESLGRHVALKVLPPGRTHSNLLERFRLEARSAARLHHTNIVPVYSVGEEGGTHYFAMQFIHGQSMDRVLEDVRRFHDEQPTGPDLAGKADGSTMTATLARNLVSGQFFVLNPDPGPGIAGATEPASTRTDTPRSYLAHPSTAVTPRVAIESSSLSGLQGSKYIRGIARIGLDVAEALSYAHQQKVLHRDIKPSNLLLDLQGTVWVTDFGLAKAEGADDLTAPHDIVGTLRYMPPERFSGRSDPRSDVYGLGATLYELLTLRPAFDAEDRVTLVEKVLHAEPTRPRRLVPTLPRDLETIVLKAMAKEPDARYPTASAMADDLRLLLEGRPIRARRTSTPERAWRWCRRNPVVAALSAIALSLVLTLAVGSTIAALHLDHARDVAIRHLERAKDSERARTEQLRESLIDQARARRMAGGPGQRFETADALHRASRIRVDDELRDEAITCLALPDLRPVQSIGGGSGDLKGIDIDDSFDRYAVSNSMGDVQVLRTRDEAELFRFGGFGTLTGNHLLISRDGRSLAQVTLDRGQPWSGRLRAWRLAEGGARPLIDTTRDVLTWAVDFTSDSRWLVFARVDGSLAITSCETGERRDLPPIRGRPAALACHPDGHLLAVSLAPSGAEREHAIEVRTLEDPRPIMALKVPAQVDRLVWSPDGRSIAAAAWYSIHLWTVDRNQHRVLQGHKNAGIAVAFNHRGDRLASVDWDGSLRLWDVQTGSQLITGFVGSLALPRFRGDDRLLRVGQRDSRWTIYEVKSSEAYRSIVGVGRVDRILRISPDSRLLAIGTTDGFRIWELASCEELCSISGLGRTGVVFDADNALLSASPAGVFRWPISRVTTDTGMGKTPVQALQVGPPERLHREASPRAEVDCSQDGRVVAFIDSHGAVVLHRGLSPRTLPLPLPGVRHLAVSPDGRWLVTCHDMSGHTMVWDAASGEQVCRLPPSGIWFPIFSPDSRRLSLINGDRGEIYEVGSWKLLRNQASFGFSADGQIMAVPHGPHQIDLLDPESGGRLLRLEDPQRDRIAGVQFSPDGRKLVAIGRQQEALHIWDFSRIRAELEGFLPGARLPEPVGMGPRSEQEVPPLPVRVEPQPPAPGFLEAELLRIRMATCGPAFPQHMREFGTAWSGDRQLIWHCTQEGGTLALEVPVERTGLFEVSMGFTKAPDFGVATLTMDHQPLGVPIDLYSRRVIHEEVHFEPRELAKGMRVLRVKMGGKNAASVNYRFGLDWIKVTPHNESTSKP